MNLNSINCKKALDEAGVFISQNFIDREKCSLLSDKIIKFIDDIDKNTTKEYDDYIVLDTNDANRGSAWMNSQSKPVINVRGNHRHIGTYDSGLIDIFNPEKLFDELNEFKNNELFQSFSKLVGSSKIMTHIYYNDGILDTRTWHKDSSIIKFFIYLTDVPEECGPYGYILGSHNNSPTLQHSQWFEDRQSDLDVYNPADELKVKLVGNKGDLIGSYQWGYHRGFPQEVGKKRLVYVFRIADFNKEG